jgi:hypothetical protein
LKYQRLRNLAHLAAYGSGGILGAAGGFVHLGHAAADAQSLQDFLDPAGAGAQMLAHFPPLFSLTKHGIITKSLFIFKI